MKKRGTILAENIIFIVLNLVFLSIIFLFLFSKMGDVATMEEKYAKEISLIIDSAKPGMNISLNMADAVKQAGKEEWNSERKKIVSIQNNIVTVKINGKGNGYSYSFFNDVDFEKLYHYVSEGNILFLEIKEKQKEVTEEFYSSVSQEDALKLGIGEKQKEVAEDESIIGNEEGWFIEHGE